MSAPKTDHRKIGRQIERRGFMDGLQREQIVFKCAL